MHSVLLWLVLKPQAALVPACCCCGVCTSFSTRRSEKQRFSWSRLASCSWMSRIPIHCMELLGPLQPSYKCHCWNWAPYFLSTAALRESFSWAQALISQCPKAQGTQECSLHEASAGYQWSPLRSADSVRSLERGCWPAPDLLHCQGVISSPFLLGNAEVISWAKGITLWGGKSGCEIKPFISQAPTVSEGPFSPFTTSVF